MTKLNRPVLRWLPAVLMMAAIFGFSSIPSDEMPTFGGWDTLVKKGGHALGYGLLALAYRFALGEQTRSLFLAWLLAALYSATDEFHQSFVPGRNPAARDVLIDSLGAALALLVWFWRSRRTPPLLETNK